MIAIVSPTVVRAVWNTVAVDSIKALTISKATIAAVNMRPTKRPTTDQVRTVRRKLRYGNSKPGD